MPRGVSAGSGCRTWSFSWSYGLTRSINKPRKVCTRQDDAAELHQIQALAAETVLTEHRAVAVGDHLPLHRQLHLDTRLRPGAEDGDAHTLLYAGSKH